jgi:hypothetical protein
METEAKVLATFIENWQLFTVLGISIISLSGVAGYLAIGEDFRKTSQGQEGTLESQEGSGKYD